MLEQPLVFKHVKNGAPIDPKDLPKLPPHALRVMLEKLREHNLGSTLQGTHPSFALVAQEIAIDLVAICLKRLDPSVTVEHIAHDEDNAMVQRAYGYIQRANTDIFPPARRDDEVQADPKLQPLA